MLGYTEIIGGAAVCYHNNMSTMCICISYPCFLPCFSKHLNENDCNRSPKNKIERSRKKIPGNFVIADKNRLKIWYFSRKTTKMLVSVIWQET